MIRAKISINVILYIIIFNLILSIASCGNNTDNSNTGNTTDNNTNNNIQTSADANDNLSPLEKLEFSKPGGLYQQSFLLELTTNRAGLIIRYTTDGSDPTNDSDEYTSGQILISDRQNEPNKVVKRNTSNIGNVFKGTVIKAAVFSSDGEKVSDIYVQSYFVSQDIFTRYNLPIVSIATDTDNFFSNKTGIYRNYSKSGDEWERPVHFEFYEKDGQFAVSLDLGVRINGGYTRKFNQKALRLYTRPDYDSQTSIKYEIFPGLTTSYNNDPVTFFKRLVLRCSGNDNEKGTLFRDALIQSLVSDLNIDTQAYRPCVAFVNGEFWGIYNLRERYDKYYFSSHYDINQNKVAMLSFGYGCENNPELCEGEESDIEYYNKMYDFFNRSSMSNDTNYQKALEYIDIDNFIDYYIANIYSGNHDWPGNNNIMWRYKTDNGGYDPDALSWYKDGRFRWVMKDTDFGFGLLVNYDEDSLSITTRDYDFDDRCPKWANMFFRKLLKNNQFKNKFINRFCDIMNTNYKADVVVAKINEMKSDIETAIPEHSARYPSSISSVSEWNNSVKNTIKFARKRTTYMQNFIKNKFSLSPITEVILKTNSTMGYIRINDTNITTGTKGVTDSSLWNGNYFAGTTQVLTAIPYSGYKFVKYIVTNTSTGESVEYTSSNLSILLDNNGNTIEAVFEKTDLN